QLGGNGVHRRDQVLELAVVDDQPVEAVLVALALDRRARLLRDGLHELIDVVEGAAELAGRLRLESDRARAGRLESELDVERYGRRRQREQPVLLRLGQ